MTEYNIASAENERPIATFGLEDRCTSTAKKCATLIIILAFNFLLLHFPISVLCCIAACFAMEKEAPTETDLGSYEGKYPKDLFNKTVIVNEQAIGRVAKETDDVIVVFSDSGNLRFDIPKSKITRSGGSVVVGEPLEQYAVDRDVPMPEDKSLRPSAEEIQQKAGEIPEGPTLPVEEGKPSIVEEKVKDVATEVKSSVGYELGQASKTVKEKMKDAGEAVVNVDVEGAARQAASGIKDLAQAGAETAKEKMAAAQSSTEAGLSVENMMKF